MLSIIIPHYNSVKTLEKLLNSIPSLDNIEIIVIDDKSTIDSKIYNQLTVSQEYKHVSFLYNDTNKKGAGVCRNIGLKHMTGKWVLFADSDDFFVEGFYQTIEKYFDSDNDVVFFSPTSMEVDSKIKSNRHIDYEKKILDYIKSKDRISELKLRYEFPVPWSKLIRVSLIKENKIQFDEVIASNDIMFSAKIGYYSKKIDATDEVIYCVTKGKGSLTNNTSETVFDTRLKVRINYCDFVKSKLSAEDQKVINLSGRAMLLFSITYKLGIKKVVTTYIKLKMNRIEVLNSKYFNLIFLFKKVKHQYKVVKSNKKYLSK
ncbi:glycosyltransferase family 2 protein [Oceanobacillus sp. CF4.6]|uniref:glycosyltransferase family 2 protein n=1 Tax=Oceanobacillus sp. CF4.6 TaxID=3373080 RepID=UPI003EE61BA3